MAGPLIELLQGLRARRQRRRSGWGGGEAPGMRDMINPLDSQAMTDRAQGVDISSSMPSTRLETSFSQPVAESFATAQLPVPAASSVTPQQDFAPQLEERSPFMTAAGSNATAAPVRGSQCPGGVCPTGPAQSFSQGPNLSDYGITLAPGETFGGFVGQTQSAPVNPAQVFSPQPAGQPPMAGGQPAAASPADAWGNYQRSFQAFAADPRNANWLELSRTLAEQADTFQRLSSLATNTSEKHWYKKQAQQFGMEAINSVAAGIKQAEAMRREESATRGRGVTGKLAAAREFLATPNGDYGPEERAAIYLGQYRQLAGMEPIASREDILRDPEYRNALGTAYASEVASMAADNSVAGVPVWGTQEDRDAGLSPAFARAKGYYGSLPFEQAADEINSRFVPAYKKALFAANDALPPEQRRASADIHQQAADAAVMLQSSLYHDQNPDPAPRPADPVTPATPKPADGGGGFFSFPPQLWGGQ